MEEQKKFHDLLLLDLEEGYYKLTQKMMSVYTWATDRCQNDTFILKVDMVRLYHCKKKKA